MKMLINNEYLTKDLGEAAALLCRDIKLLRLQKENNFFWFVFENIKECQVSSNNYWFKRLLVNAKTFKDALDTLKNRIFSQN